MGATSLLDLGGEVAVITGSSRGIGRAMAKQMARAGARVVISSRTAENCEKVAQSTCDAATNPHYGPLLTLTDEVHDKLMRDNIRGPGRERTVARECARSRRS
jgi:dehydrogenase/reductase SDR family member 4